MKPASSSLREQGCGFGDRSEHRHKPFLVGFGEIAQHMAVHARFLAGMADADAHAAIIGPERRGDGAQAIIARVAAAGFHLQLAGGEIDLVMDDDERCERQFVEAHRCARPNAPLSFM